MRGRVAIIIVASCVLFTVAGLAHDDAYWIQRNPDYTSSIGQHCCGPKDCFRISPDLVYEDGNVIIYLPTQQKFRRGTRGTYLSETDDWWICQTRRFPGFSYPPAVCLFHPFHSQ